MHTHNPNTWQEQKRAFFLSQDRRSRIQMFKLLSWETETVESISVERSLVAIVLRMNIEILCSLIDVKNKPINCSYSMIIIIFSLVSPFSQKLLLYFDYTKIKKKIYFYLPTNKLILILQLHSPSNEPNWYSDSKFQIVQISGTIKWNS